jgi:hypothetical protein
MHRATFSGIVLPSAPELDSSVARRPRHRCSSSKGGEAFIEHTPIPNIIQGKIIKTSNLANLFWYQRHRNNTLRQHALVHLEQEVLPKVSSGVVIPNVRRFAIPDEEAVL